MQPMIANPFRHEASAYWDRLVGKKSVLKNMHAQLEPSKVWKDKES